MAVAISRKVRRPSRQRVVEKTTQAREAPPPLDHLHRFSVDQYQQMIDEGFFAPETQAELLDGLVVRKMPKNPPHSVILDLVRKALRKRLPDDLHLRSQDPIVTSRSQPEPDLAVVRGPETIYYDKHPRPVDVFLVVEVADSSSEHDRERKGSIYAQAKLPFYWIINVQESRVEVYSAPQGGNRPRFLERNDFDLEGTIPLIVQDKHIATIPVRELFFIPDKKR